MTRTEPAEIAASLERAATLPEGEVERFVGYGVMAAPFSSADLLAMRRFPASSLGQGYTTVQHRNEAGEWTYYSDRRSIRARATSAARSLTPSKRGRPVVAGTETPADPRARRRSQLECAARADGHPPRERAC